MLASVMTTKVQSKITDTSYTGVQILALLNLGQLEVAGGGVRPHGLPKVAPLPDLLSSDTVTAAVDARSVALPDEYHRGLFMVVDASGEEVTIKESYIDHLERFPTLETGSTEQCCVMGSSLHYAPSEAQDLTVHFYRLPVDMETDDEADGIPTHLQERLLVSYAVKEIFGEIEQGIDGNTPNADKWEARYQLALTDLEREIGPEDGRPQYAADDTNYIGD
ncbi:MAG: hypothetical protein GY820_38945 [Gammaproteobacteria bacterium]|nr:hypothetical protein [Gammaproteobacteria bacterium]